MEVRTTRVVLLPAEDAWRLLWDSRLELRTRCPVFFLGAPKPHECAIPSGEGGLGAERECRAHEGTIRQRITVWEPPSHLRFRMERTTLGFDRYVDEMVDDFVLTPHARGTAVTRRTTFRVRGPLRWVRYVMVYSGLKSAHRYVFRNWQVAPQNIPASD